MQTPRCIYILTVVYILNRFQTIAIHGFVSQTLNVLILRAQYFFLKKIKRTAKFGLYYKIVHPWHCHLVLLLIKSDISSS